MKMLLLKTVLNTQPYNILMFLLLLRLSHFTLCSIFHFGENDPAPHLSSICSEGENGSGKMYKDVLYTRRMCIRIHSLA